MLVVWEDVVASLVEGRENNEESCVWIQREITSADGGPKLEALHQIPLKCVEDITYLGFYGDHRFAIKTHYHDEVQFRCREESSAMNWVAILHHAKCGN